MHFEQAPNELPYYRNMEYRLISKLNVDGQSDFVNPVYLEQ